MTQVSSGTHVTILGGPSDGRVVDWCGWTMLEPVPAPMAACDYRPLDRPPEPFAYPCYRYDARQDDDGRWWYVLVR